jgi:soluble lytic murein transglycosylase
MKKRTQPRRSRRAKKNKRKKQLWPLLLAALCLLGVLFGSRALQAVERQLYPCTYEQYVTYYAAQYGLEPAQIYAIIRTESGFDPLAESSVGARGLMQITEETFDWLKSKLAPEDDVTFDDLYTPQQNIRFGAYLLSMCLDLYAGDLSTAAAAYHSGIGLVNRLLQDEAYSEEGATLHTFPYTQMSHYVNKVQKNYLQYKRLYFAE